MKSATPQAEIDELLNSGGSSVVSVVRPLRVSSKPAEKNGKQSEAPSEDYEQEEFDDYEETRKLDTVSYRSDFHAQSNADRKRTKTAIPAGKQNSQIDESVALVEESMPKTEIEESRMSRTVGNPVTSTGKPLQTIKEEPSKVRKASRQQKPAKVSQPANKYLPYNFAKLRDTEKQRLFTSLYEDINRYKQQINDLKEELKNTNSKYNALLEKTPQVERVKQEALLKENAALKQKVDSLLQIKKKFDDQNSFSKLSRTQMSSPTQQAKSEPPVSQREQELLRFIDQLKNRLKDSQANLKGLQQKMNEGLDFERHFKQKARNVESLEFRMAKLSEQAEADRLLIDQLKLKVQESSERLAQEREKNARMDREFRRVELSVATNNDLARQLQQVRKQKERLEKSLRDITGTLVSRVTEKNKEAQKKLQPMGHIEVLDFN